MGRKAVSKAAASPAKGKGAAARKNEYRIYTPHELRRFTEVYATRANFSGAEAAMICGFSSDRRDAGVIAARLMRRPIVRDMIEQYQAGAIEANFVQQADILRKLSDMAFFDIRSILTEEGALKPLSEWPEGAGTSVSGMDIRQVDAGDESLGKIIKLRLRDNTKPLEMLGKHIGMFIEKKIVELSSKKSLAELVAEIETDE